MSGLEPWAVDGLSWLAGGSSMTSVGHRPPSAGPSESQVNIRAPGRQLGTLRRGRLEEAVSFADGSHRITVVSAPAGYGKTTLLADWSRNCGAVCAWLSFDPYANDSASLHHWIIRALQSVAGNLHGPVRAAVTSLDPVPGPDPVEDYRGVIRALEMLAEPLALVIDDLHLAGPALDDGLLGALVRSGPPGLHLVLSSRGDPALSLAAQRLRGTVTDVGARALAFTPDETSELLTLHGLDGSVEGIGLWNATGGWPVAITEGLVLREEGMPAATAFSPEPRRVFLDYVAQEILARCPVPLSEFVLRATTRNRITRQLAIDLCDDDDGAMLLEHCLQQGFFLAADHLGSAEETYTWQPLFAMACRTILSHRDPQLARALHGAAARHYQDVDVPTCVSEALLGGEPRTAMKSIGEHWLEMIVAGGAASLEQLCLRLPFPWSEDPEMLLVRSSCRALAGDLPSSITLGRRASSGMSGLGAARRRRFEANRALFELFVLGQGDPAAAARQGIRLVDLATEHPTAMLANGFFLLGRAQTRAGHPGKVAIDLLREATAAGSANGLTTVEVCAGAELALALAVNGDFSAAEEQGAVAIALAETCAWPCQASLAPVWVARGLVAYWRDDLDRADHDLARAMDVGSAPFPSDSLGMVYRILVDCATGDPVRIAASELAFRAFEAQEPHDSSWPVLAMVAAAKLREAAGDVEGAAAMVRPLARGGASPLADALVAELLRQAGETDKALVCTGALAEQANPLYVETSSALTEALIAYSAGESAVAHERLEYAVRCAEPESVLRPFVERRGDLLQLLVQHAAWGTAHDAFIASTLTHRPPEHVQRRQHSLWTLSEREREVLSHMRTLLTAAEIADSLFISVNTLKSHQQSIYRKLGATNRRSAVRIATARGLI
ncbi:LuxR family transcriptional regulator, maltose regulon positive regulatory protein [Citricoccus sp. K5]|nr:LuxR family transcriptional regulator, maltose regulon positive regulatory protein [Citricoccus sp. K5]